MPEPPWRPAGSRFLMWVYRTLADAFVLKTLGGLTELPASLLEEVGTELVQEHLGEEPREKVFVASEPECWRPWGARFHCWGLGPLHSQLCAASVR